MLYTLNITMNNRLFVYRGNFQKNGTEQFDTLKSFIKSKSPILRLILTYNPMNIKRASVWLHNGLKGFLSRDWSKQHWWNAVARWKKIRCLLLNDVKCDTYSPMKARLTTHLINRRTYSSARCVVENNTIQRRKYSLSLFLKCRTALMI